MTFGITFWAKSNVRFPSWHDRTSSNDGNEATMASKQYARRHTLDSACSITVLLDATGRPDLKSEPRLKRRMTADWMPNEIPVAKSNTVITVNSRSGLATRRRIAKHLVSNKSDDPKHQRKCCFGDRDDIGTKPHPKSFPKDRLMFVHPAFPSDKNHDFNSDCTNDSPTHLISSSLNSLPMSPIDDLMVRPKSASRFAWVNPRSNNKRWRPREKPLTFNDYAVSLAPISDFSLKEKQTATILVTITQALGGACLVYSQKPVMRWTSSLAFSTMVILLGATIDIIAFTLQLSTAWGNRSICWLCQQSLFQQIFRFFLVHLTLGNTRREEISAKGTNCDNNKNEYGYIGDDIEKHAGLITTVPERKSLWKFLKPKRSR